MSSGGGEQASSMASSRKGKKSKRARARACDQCRRRKVRCDAAEVQGPRCSSCIAFGFDCTYVAGTDKRFTNVDYVKSLEKDLEEMRQLCLKQQALLSAHGIVTNTSETTSPSPTHSTPVLPSSSALTPDPEATLTDDDQDVTKGLVERFKGLEIELEEMYHIGRSSSLTLIRTAIDMKEDYVQRSSNASQAKEFSLFELTSQRPEFWHRRGNLLPEAPYTDFPRPALMNELVEKYFELHHPMFPLLHHPTFEQGIRTGLHTRDEGFGATVLLVCAIASKLSEDPAVLPSGTHSRHWAGWQWFEQVCLRRKLIALASPTLYDLQIACLAANFIGSSAVPRTNCALIGHGLRLAQDMGLHRRTAYGATPTVEAEQKKRAFWCLLAMERGMCLVLGRQCSLQEEDFDIDYPAECDDEYWTNDDPQLAFKQPEDKPSKVTYFNWSQRLGRINTFIFRGLYSRPASKVLHDAERTQRIVSELDSELNKWVDSLPPHLKWDPDQANPLFADQSATLYSAYYLTRITIHRLFIPGAHKPLSSPFPSFEICTNAARSCVQILDRYHRRFGAERVLPGCQLMLFISAIILLLSAWSGKHTGSTINAEKEMEEVEKTLGMLKAIEPKYNSAGRLWDILNDLKTVVNEPAHQHARTRKRGHDEIVLDDDAETDPKQPQKRLQQPAPSSESMPATAFPLTDRNPDLSHPSSSLDGSSSGANLDYSDIWQAFGAQFDTGSQPPFGSFMPIDSMFPVDPELEAVFASFMPGSLGDDPFAALSQTTATYPDLFPSGTATGAQPADLANDFTPLATSHQQATDMQFTGHPPPIWDAGPSDLSWSTDRYLTSMASPSGDGFPSASHWSSEPSA